MAIFVCAHCRLEYKDFRKKCICGKIYSIIQLPGYCRSQKKIRTAEDLKNEETESVVIPGYDFLGSVPKRWSVLVSGPPGGGKSTFCLQLASVLATKKLFLYWAYEEGFNESLKYKLRINNIENSNLLFSQAIDLDEFLNDVYTFNPGGIAIDSLNDLELSTKDIKKIKQKTNCPLFFIAHYLKIGTAYKGSSSLEHEVDISIEVRKGIATTKKNRFGPCGESKKLFDIKE